MPNVTINKVSYTMKRAKELGLKIPKEAKKETKKEVKKETSNKSFSEKVSDSTAKK